METYVQRYDICLALKTVRYKYYGNLQSLPMLIHHFKDLLIDFVINLLISTDKKMDSYNAILIIEDYLIKMVYYKPV